jgi:EKC/KEOPS complex subunit CGI121/TPRKB
MSSSSTLQLPHLPGYLIHALLFRDVKNAAALRKELIAGNADFEYAFLDAIKVNSMPSDMIAR